MRYQNIRSLSFTFVTIHASDGRTDGQTDRQNCDSNTVRCIACRTVKSMIMVNQIYAVHSASQSPKCNQLQATLPPDSEIILTGCQYLRGLPTISASSSTGVYIRLLQSTFKSCWCQSQPLPVAVTCTQLLVVIYKNCYFRTLQFCCECAQTLEQFTILIPRVDIDTIWQPAKNALVLFNQRMHLVTA